MNKKNILDKLKKLKKMSYKKQYKETNKYSIEELELLAIELYNDYLKNGFKKNDNLLDDILHERVVKINNEFIWTNENKEKILKINQKITQTFEKAYKEAISTAKELEDRIIKNDSFIKDYEIEIKISLYMNEEYYKDDFKGSIGYVLSEPITNYYPINYYIGHNNLNKTLSETPIYLDAKLNWNNEYFGDIFKNDYIGYAIHALLDTHQWSFKDIISITKIWADVEVYHQYYNEII